MASGLQVDTRQFKRFIARLNKDVQKNVVKRAYDRVVPEFLDTVAKRTPVGETEDAREGWEVLGENFDGTEQFVVVGNRVFYVWFLEFGTIHVQAIGMFGRTLREYGMKGNKIVGAIGDELRKEIKRAMRRGQ